MNTLTHRALAVPRPLGLVNLFNLLFRRRPAWLLPVLLLGLLLPGPSRAQLRPPRRLPVGGQLAGGGSHSLLARPDGQFTGWGRNQFGQLGDGTTTQRLTPVAAAGGVMPAGTRPTQVAAGYQHSLALAADGTLYAWGDNYDGQLGNGTTIAETAPIAVALPAAPRPVQVAAGMSHSLALIADGTLYAWGNNYNGQLGDGTLTPRPAPIAVDLSGLPAGTHLVQVAGGLAHSLALAADGTLYAWGLNNYGQLGDGTTASRLTPVAVRLGGLPTGTRLVQIAVGEYHSLALAADGRLYAWGLNYTGQLGDGTATDRSRPVAVALPAGTRLVQVAAGGAHTLGLAADGTAYAWGYNSAGQVGNGTTSAYVARPVAVVPGAMPAGTRLGQVAAGEHHSLALAADGTVYTWGYNDHGQLGDGTATDRLVPVAPGSLPLPAGYAQAAGGLQHSLGLRADGTVVAWGDNGSGQLGDGTTTPHPTPVALPAGTRCVQVAAGYLHSLALAADGTLYAWGDNYYGQLGDGSTSAHLIPVAVALPAGARCVQVVAGESHALALLADGTVYAWGNNTHGQLGDGTTNTQHPTPVAVDLSALPANTRLVQVAAGVYHSLALAADGTAYAWGANAAGQLGTGALGADSSTPVAVAQGALPAGMQLVQVAAGLTHSLGLAADGTAYAWGYNAFGQLGDGTTNTQRPAPTAIDLSALPAGTRLVQVMAGLAHSLALAADGRLYSWGLNDTGQLGHNSTTNQPVPLAEASGRPQWRQVAAGPMANHSLVLGAGAAVFTAGLNDGGQLGDGSTRNSLVFVRNGTPLPVQLMAFTAQASGPAAVQLTWATASEANSARFEVERSADGTRFAKLGAVAAAGTSSSSRTYTYLDVAALAGTSYYRLRQVDQDGSAHYSPVRTVGLIAPAGLHAYPVPARAGQLLTVAGLPGTAPVEVLDLLGRRVATAAARPDGTAPLLLPSALPAGSYVVRSGTATTRLVLE